MGFYLSNLRTKEDLKKIAIGRWNYNPYISYFPHDFNKETEEKIKDTEIVAEYADFEIVFFQLSEDDERILRKTEKEIIKQIPTAYRNQYLYVFSSKNGNYWHFCNADSYKTALKLKRFVITPDNRENLRTPSERLDKLRIESDKDKNLEDVKRKVEEAFSVDVITKEFYEKYKGVFSDLKGYLNDQKSDLNSAHHYAHQLLNRIMFLYFVQKRNCFGNDKNFLKTFWNAYKDDFYGKNEFHKRWLEVLFFEALSLRKSDYKDKSYFELKNFNRILREAPYLNGGLFRKNEWDRMGYEIEDEIFDKIFGFFEGYNFTIQESTPLDQDLAIDPEMLGNIYEMVIASENDERHKAGIFYTPKLEIELMIRRSIVEYLYNKTKIDKKRLYLYVFKEHGEEWKPDFSKEEQEKLLNELNDLRLVDPACGSGHYLVVATQILYELKEIIYQLKVRSLDKFEEKKRIVEQSIFGVDTKEWAAEIAKMRLWLDLFIDAEEERLKDSQEPLLPILSFKIRVGDSLVQKLGKEMLPLKKLSKSFPKYKKDIDYVTGEKVLAYQNKCDSKKVTNDERKLIGDIFTKEDFDLKQKIQKQEIKIRKLKGIDGLFLDEKKEDLFSREEQQELEELKKKSDEIEKFLENFRKLKSEDKEPPLIWDIAFADVFSEKDGFDIVIANPPYVRQELINNKQELSEQMKSDWGLKELKIDKRSDLYIYFYLKGLKLLNRNGIMCYISSNSWLDVGYGKGLQEILLKYVPIVAIYDNQVKRVFKHADVNTIIAILKAPREKDFEKDVRENTVKFVNFKKPFEEIMFTETFLKIEEIKERKQTEDFKIFPIKQIDLWKEGIGISKDKISWKEIEKQTYTGDKWGGKYLRAPEIYWKILEKGKDKLVRLGDIAEVNEGKPTGANDYFFLPLERAKEYKIEDDFLLPGIMKTRRMNYLIIDFNLIGRYFLQIQKNENEIRKLNVYKYLDYGRREILPKSNTLKSKPIWWRFSYRKPADLLCPCGYGETIFCAINEARAVASNSYTEIRLKDLDYKYPLFIFINSVIGWLFLEILGRKSLGGGMIKIDPIEYRQMYVLNKKLMPSKLSIKNRMVKSIFSELGFDKNKPIRSQQPKPLPDRAELDNIVFDELGLTEQERKEVYWAVAELVKNRLDKAGSFNAH